MPYVNKNIRRLKQRLHSLIRDYEVLCESGMREHERVLREIGMMLSIAQREYRDEGRLAYLLDQAEEAMLSLVRLAGGDMLGRLASLELQRTLASYKH